MTWAVGFGGHFEMVRILVLRGRIINNSKIVFKGYWIYGKMKHDPKERSYSESWVSLSRLCLNPKKSWL